MLFRSVKLAWPSVVELTLTQLASMVDLMMVGGLGAWALTSVGLTVQPKFLLMALFMAMNIGATAMVARYKGAGRPDKANLILRQAIMLTLVISVISSIFQNRDFHPDFSFHSSLDGHSLLRSFDQKQQQCQCDAGEE